MAALITNLFTTKFAILKWFQILCCIITVLFLIDGRMQWWPYTLVFICAIILGILCFATLLIHYFVIQSNNRAKIPLSSLEFVFNVVALLISVGFAILLIIDYAKMMGGQFDHHRYQPPQNIGKPGWRNRILVVFIAQALAAICFGISVFEAKKIRSR